MRITKNSPVYGNGQTNAINTVPSIEEVDYLRDYLFTGDQLEQFKVDPNNRPSEIDDATVKKYSKIMLNGDWFFELAPIYVGIKSMTIFNGEHRRKAIVRSMEKDSKFKPVVHVRFVDDSVRASDKRDALNAGKHWNSDDYVEAQISGGNGLFALLKEFALDEDHPHLHSKRGKPFYNKSAICFGSTYSEFKDGYETGDWKVNKKFVDRREQTYGEMARIRKAVFPEPISHDFWLNFGDAWKTFRYNEAVSSRILRLPEGIESFFDALGRLGPLNSYKVGDWTKRFSDALYEAEKAL